jgi:glycerol-3-phosphate acyltransferase PlsY
MQTIPSVPTNRSAIASLVCGLAGWLVLVLSSLLDAVIGAVTFGLGALCLWPLDFVPPILWLTAVITGHIALRRIKQTGGRGRSLAIGGLVIGYVSLGFLVALVVLIIFLLVSGIGLAWLTRFFPLLQPQQNYKIY